MRSFTRGGVVAALALVGCAALCGPALGAHASQAAAITALKVSGTSSRPVFTIVGHGLSVPEPNPKVSPSNQPLCPVAISGNAGLDYGMQFSLVAWDGQPDSTNAQLYAAGRYRPSLNELDCIGIVVLSHTAERVTFTLGHAYQEYYKAKPRWLKNGDVVEVTLKGATFATVLHFGRQ